MTEIFNDITAALLNRNTTANAIIWTNAKASLEKKRAPVVVVAVAVDDVPVERSKSANLLQN